MFTKKLTAISIATVATLGVFALGVESASARPGGHGLRGGGGHHVMRHVGFRHHGHWGHRRYGYGWGIYGTPLLVGATSYALDCYHVRRHGVLYRVCD